MKISVASGKGGTGKTTMSLVISRLLQERTGTLCITDCDVEEPNSNLFLKFPLAGKKKISVAVPVVDFNACTACGKCGDICQFSAIVLVGDRPLVFPEMCHACGGCSLVCEPGAISESPREIGYIEEAEKDGLRYVGGRLNVGEAMAPPLIREVKKDASFSETAVFDAPPGTSCPVIETIRDSDYIVLVTEPTPFGLNDLRLAVEMVRYMGLPFGVVINRCDLGDDRVEHFCDEENIPVLAMIPNDRKIAEAYSRGEVAEAFISLFRRELSPLIDTIMKYSSGGPL